MRCEESPGIVARGTGTAEDSAEAPTRAQVPVKALRPQGDGHRRVLCGVEDDGIQAHGRQLKDEAWGRDLTIISDPIDRDVIRRNAEETHLPLLLTRSGRHPTPLRHAIDDGPPHRRVKVHVRPEDFLSVHGQALRHLGLREQDGLAAISS